MEEVVGRARVERAEERQKQKQDGKEGSTETKTHDEKSSSSSESRASQDTGKKREREEVTRMEDSDIADQIDQSKWAKFQERIKKRAAEQD
eukprot:1775965-Karenia_brevis.AAC.1